MQDPAQARVPELVPAEWAISYGPDRTQRHVLLATELERLERASRRDTSRLLGASWLCLLLLVAALGWAGTIPSSAGMSVAALGLLSTLASCLWLVQSAQGSDGP